MKIVSCFKDYYDSCLSFGFSELPLYVREPKKVSIEGHVDIPYSVGSYTSGSVIIDIGCVGFCGKLYPFVQDLEYNYHYQPYEGMPVGCNERVFDFYKRSHRNPFTKVVYTPSEDCQDIQEKLRSPILVCRVGSPYRHPKYEFIVDERLSTMQFYKVKDHVSCFSEIEMWLSNLASPEKEIPLISNDDMIEAKGFSRKFSFRKEKTLK